MLLLLPSSPPSGRVLLRVHIEHEDIEARVGCGSCRALSEHRLAGAALINRHNHRFHLATLPHVTCICPATVQLCTTALRTNGTFALCLQQESQAHGLSYRTTIHMTCRHFS